MGGTIVLDAGDTFFFFFKKRHGPCSHESYSLMVKTDLEQIITQINYKIAIWTSAAKERYMMSEEQITG